MTFKFNLIIPLGNEMLNEFKLENYENIRMKGIFGAYFCLT